jgi:uncharacterized protein YndB with AHSA1/START domain
MTRYPVAEIQADPNLPIIRITRDFRASTAQLMTAHLDPQVFARWVGPAGISTRIDHWDARTGGSWRFTNIHDGQEYSFHGCFHEMPEAVALETLRFTDLGDGTTRLIAQSLTDSFEGRDAWLASGMEVGVNDGYAKLDGLLAGSESPVQR